MGSWFVLWIVALKLAMHSNDGLHRVMSNFNDESFYLNNYGKIIVLSIVALIVSSLYIVLLKNLYDDYHVYGSLIIIDVILLAAFEARKTKY